MKIALNDIDPFALPRDRTMLCEVALGELRNSIASHGLRTPIEVMPLTGPVPYGLLSGFRRLTVFQRLAELNSDYQSIPATIKTPESIPQAITLMVEENHARADISPFEQAAIAVTATEAGHFDTLDAAIRTLFASANKQKRYRKVRFEPKAIQEKSRASADPRRALANRSSIELYPTAPQNTRTGRQAQTKRLSWGGSALARRPTALLLRHVTTSVSQGAAVDSTETLSSASSPQQPMLLLR